MTPLTPEEIRAFAKACGWQLANKMLNVGLTNPWWLAPDGKTRKLPNFANDLQACFEGLEWFCRQESGIDWEVYSCRRAGGYGCSIHTTSEIVLGDGVGETKQAAIIRAVLAASRRKR